MYFIDLKMEFANSKVIHIKRQKNSSMSFLIFGGNLLKISLTGKS